MGPKQIDVTCPCCSTILTVDVLTRQVLRREEPRTGPAGEDGGAAGREQRWNAAKGTVEGRSKSAQDKLDEAMADERGKEARLDDLFRKAQEKLSRKDEDDR